MDRRWVGLLIIGAVLVAVPVVGRLLGPGESGTAVAEPPPGPPAIGDCITERDSASFVAWWRTPEAVVPPARAQTCDGFRFAEVVLIVADPPEPTSGDGQDRLVEQCAEAGSAYVGLPVADRSGPPPLWTVASAPLPLFAGPDERQQAAGQHWLACLAAPGWQVLEDALVDDADAGYAGTLQDSIASGRHRNRLGVCVSEDPRAVAVRFLFPTARRRDVRLCGAFVRPARPGGARGVVPLPSGRDDRDARCDRRR